MFRRVERWGRSEGKGGFQDDKTGLALSRLVGALSRKSLFLELSNVQLNSELLSDLWPFQAVLLYFLLLLLLLLLKILWSPSCAYVLSDTHVFSAFASHGQQIYRHQQKKLLSETVPRRTLQNTSLARLCLTEDVRHQRLLCTTCNVISNSCQLRCRSWQVSFNKQWPSQEQFNPLRS